MADFPFFKMAAVRHLGFFKVGNFNYRGGGPICVIMPNFAKIGRNVPEIWPIFDFEDGRRPLSWIGFTRVGTTHEEYLRVFVTVQNMVIIGAEISTVCKF